MACSCSPGSGKREVRPRLATGVVLGRPRRVVPTVQSEDAEPVTGNHFAVPLPADL